MVRLHPNRVLVTGGAGFLGSHLCQRLLDLGSEVLCLDNFFTGRKENVQELMDQRSFELIRHDVNLPFRYQVDEIYNLACPASPVHYQHDPVETIKTSVLGTLHALDLAHHVGARILQASTSEVYGDPAEHPQKETYWGHVNPIGTRACYDEGKRCGETLFFEYRRKYGVDIKVARIFNTFGPRMNAADGRVVSTFIVQALQGDPISIYGEGLQTRSFCYVDDLIEGCVRLMATAEGFTGPVNLGNPHEISIRDLAQKILGLTGSRSRLVFKPLPSDDPKQRRPDISLAEEALGWEPVASLETGLLRTIEYFDALLRNGYKLPAAIAGRFERNVA